MATSKRSAQRSASTAIAGRSPAAAADLRGTGYPDLFVANDYGVSELYLNDHGHFHEAGQETGVGFAPKSGMNVAFGDIFNQGKYRDLRLQHLRGRRTDPGQQSLGAAGGQRACSTKTSRAISASNSAAGASARSSAT